jgi:hypothetical protein
LEKIMVVLLLWIKNLKYWWCANLPSSYHKRCSAQSLTESNVLGLLMWKSPVPKGKRAGKANVKSCTPKARRQTFISFWIEK